MNKKAESGDQIFLVYFLFILLIILGGIVVGDLLISGKPYDIRVSESEVLSGKIIDCLKNVEVLKKEDISNLFLTCNFDEKLFEKGFIVSINSQTESFFRYGNTVACGLQDKGEQYPRCIKTEVNLKIDGKDTEVYVLTGNNVESEVKK
ncbi:MAG TPA: hypothetical protein VHA12_00605 [Candidatus Nanoarchaeia archaeon]|nr:hypothetical protein [Candidatus Nanoarchaeia archaeon]